MNQARRKSPSLCDYFRASLDGGGGPQIGEVTCGGSTHLSCKRDQIKMRDYMDRRVTSPTWGPPPPCKQSLSQRVLVRRVHPLPPAHFDPFRFSQLEERLNSEREAPSSNPDRPEPQPRSRFGWSRHWAVTSFFLTLIRRRRKTTLLFEKSKESLPVDMVHLYFYQHITS